MYCPMPDWHSDDRIVCYGIRDSGLPCHPHRMEKRLLCACLKVYPSATSVQAHKQVDLCGIISELFLDTHPVLVFVNSAAKVDTIFKVATAYV